MPACASRASRSRHTSPTRCDAGEARVSVGSLAREVTLEKLCENSVYLLAPTSICTGEG